MLKVAVIMGSDSDFPKVEPCLNMLKKFDIPYEVRVISAHRTPAVAASFAGSARENGFGVLIAAAGKAAHLGGFLAAYTALPVIGLPIKGSALDGMDALLSMVQMPAGIPVATVAIDGAANAAILAAQMISLGDADLADRLVAYRAAMTAEVEAKDRKMQEEHGQ